MCVCSKILGQPVICNVCIYSYYLIATILVPHSLLKNKLCKMKGRLINDIISIISGKEMCHLDYRISGLFAA